MFRRNEVITLREQFKTERYFTAMTLTNYCPLNDVYRCVKHSPTYGDIRGTVATETIERFYESHHPSN